MNRLKEIKNLRELADKYGLEDREILGKYPMNRLAAIYNGIGPDSFPAWLRNCISALHPTLAPVAFIHDVEWWESDGTDETFASTNDRFRENGYRAAKAEYGWYNPHRYIVMNQARRFGNYCQMFGKDGWRKCKADREAYEADQALKAAGKASAKAGKTEDRD